MKASILANTYPDVWEYIRTNESVSVFRIILIQNECERERLRMDGMMLIPLNVANLLSSVVVLYRKNVIVTMEYKIAFNSGFLTTIVI